MSQRPAHAIDCQACANWTTDDLLCPYCQERVHRHNPELLPLWLQLRAQMVNMSGVTSDDELHRKAIAAEAYQRGLIVGTAKMLRKPGGSNRSWSYEITRKGHSLLDTKPTTAKA